MIDNYDHEALLLLFNIHGPSVGVQTIEIHGPCVTGLGPRTIQNGHIVGMCLIQENFSISTVDIR